MPREHKNRGRRDEKKRKRAEEAAQLRAQADAGSESPTKRRRTSPSASQDAAEGGARQQRDYLPLNEGDESRPNEEEDDYQEADDNNHAPAPPDGNEYFGILSADDQAYFKRADAMLELDNFGSLEERQLFLASVWREAEAKELKLACAQSCSRILERLIKVSHTRQLKKLWLQLRGHFLFLVQHRFAGHVCEALFLKAAHIVTKELMNGGVEQEEEEGDTQELQQNAEEDQEKDESASILMENLFLEVVAELSENMGYLMTDKFASHALRVILVVLGGKPLEDISTTNTLQSKNKERADRGASKPANPDSNTQRWRTVPESFRLALQKVSSQAIGTLDSRYLRALATQPVGNPVLQLILELEFVNQGKQTARSSSDSLFRRLLPDDPPTEGTESASFIKGLLYDPVGSRLLEVIVQHAPGKTFKSIYRSQIRDNLASALKNEVASFVCVRSLERLGREDLNHAVDQIGSELPSLIERCRHSVVKTVIERCRVREVDVQSLAQAFRVTFGDPDSGTLERMLLMESEAAVPTNTPFETPPHSSQKLHASLLIQRILESPDQVREYVNSAFLAAEASLARIACDRQATHALQAALTSSSQDKATRRSLIQSLIRSSADLATDVVGSHVLDAIWNATRDGPVFFRERIAEQLVNHEAQVRDSFSGRAIWRTWSMDLYQRRKDAWIGRIKSNDEGSTQPTKAHAPREKSAIEMARERFAARRQGANATKLGPGGVFSRGKRGAAIGAK